MVELAYRRITGELAYEALFSQRFSFSFFNIFNLHGRSEDLIFAFTAFYGLNRS